MVNYGERRQDEMITDPSVRKVERKYRGHKLEQAVNHTYGQRHQGGESTKRKGKKT